ncbi:hypothetical protein GCM10009759_75010 [Kitasatospora saccharophila]|uniref:Uncharacterized protein n=1 Tax=Kitasatospora saccharophila TaxID=407973 RepID=A0ABP5K2K4_9ACTN
MDAGWRIDYRADMALQHPRTVPIYLTSWAAYMLLRRPPMFGLKAWWGGFFEGVRVSCPPRRPMWWSTVQRMAKLGRPPVFCQPTQALRCWASVRRPGRLRRTSPGSRRAWT